MKPIASEEDVLLDEDEAATGLQVSPRTLRDWRVDGRGPTYIKVGRFVRYRRSDLRKWLDENAHHPDPKPVRRYRR